MAEQLDIDSDPFLQLLADALRAGPTSPQWHEAVAKLREGGVEHKDEYELLINARANLEAGKEYRSVRAGPEFTRKVMENVDQPPPVRSGQRLSTVALVALTVSLIAIIVLAGAAYHLLGGSPSNEDLTALYSSAPVWSTVFETDGVGEEWKRIGQLPIDYGKGMRLGGSSSAPATETGGPIGGGVVRTQPIEANKPFMLEAVIRLQRGWGDLVPQIFVSDKPDFTDDTATSSHELVWMITGGNGRVATPDTQFVGSSEHVSDGQTVTVRILVGRQSAKVQQGSKTLWEGGSQLAATPRYVGVRFLRRTTDKPDIRRDGITVQSIRVIE